MASEGVIDDLTEWLHKWKLSKYEKKLRSQGIESPEDFKFIKSKQQFDKFVLKLGDNVPYMHILKLQDAWTSIVPSTQQQPNTQIHFLGDDEKEIMDKLYKRYNDTSDDVSTVQKATNEFNESVVQTKKIINEHLEKMITIINNKRDELLNKINIIDDKNKKILNKKLQDLKNINKICLQKKQIFEAIALDKKIAKPQKLEKLNQLLSINLIHIANDDEKKVETDNYDNYKIIGNKCIMPGKINIKIDQQSFAHVVNSFASISCDVVTTDWKMKRSYVENNFQTKITAMSFDKTFSQAYYTINEEDTCATKQTGSYPSVKLLPAVGNQNETIKFKITGYGWYGIGDDQTVANTFAGYTDHGWMVRNSDGGMYAHNGRIADLNPVTGNCAGKVVEMSFDSSTRKLTVTVDKKQHVSTELDVDVKNNVYFLMTGMKIKYSDHPSVASETMPVFNQATKFARIGSRYNLIKARPNRLTKIASRNSAQHWDLQHYARQWPRFPALPKGHIPDDDVILSVIVFWFFVKSRMMDDEEPPALQWQEAKVPHFKTH